MFLSYSRGTSRYESGSVGGLVGVLGISHFDTDFHSVPLPPRTPPTLRTTVSVDGWEVCEGSVFVNQKIWVSFSSM